MPSHALGGGIPDEFVNLETKADVQLVADDPVGQVAWREHAVGSIARAGGIFAECRREDHAASLGLKLVLASEVAGEFVIALAGDNALDFVVLGERVEVFEMEAVAFARIGALHIGNFVNGLRNVRQWTLAAGFNQDLISTIEQPLHKWHESALLQHRLTARNLYQTIW